MSVLKKTVVRVAAGLTVAVALAKGMATASALDVDCSNNGCCITCVYTECICNWNDAFPGCDCYVWWDQYGCC
jgi:hypothetical protein